MPIVLLKDLAVRIDVGRRWFTRLGRTTLNDCLLRGDGKKISVDKCFYYFQHQLVFIPLARPGMSKWAWLSYPSHREFHLNLWGLSCFSSLNHLTKFTDADKLCPGIEANGVSHSAAHACLKCEKSIVPRKRLFSITILLYQSYEKMT